MDGPDFFRWAIAILGGAALAWLLWISIQSLRQAALLKRLAAGDMPGHLDRPIALHGAVRVHSPVRAPVGVDCLWYREICQERRGWGKNRHWRTLSDEWRIAGFTVNSRGEEIRISGDPTEIHGKQSHRDTDYAGFLSFDNDTRVVVEWLPVPARVTVIGRLAGAPGRFAIERDRHHGLLLSPDSPEKTASRETLKGWSGLVAVVAGAAGLAWLLAQVLS